MNSEKLEQMAKDRYIRFDWAAKRMLRDKANFDVLEGLITVLLGEKVKIDELLESESNQEARDDKFNRVDIKAKNSKGEIIIVEIQTTRELYYLERILYGTAKSITEHISLGEKYDKIRKVYNISILYFDLGKGADYLYHGQTTFTGVHTGDTLQINTREKDVIQMKTPSQIFPEYFIIRVNEFNAIASNPLEEWLEYLKTGEIREGTSTPGLVEAGKKLKYMQMSRSEQAAYDRHINDIMIENDVLSTARKEGLYDGRMEGLAEGRAEGIAEGRAEGIEEGRARAAREAAAKFKAAGVDIATIVSCTGLSAEEVNLL